MVRGRRPRAAVAASTARTLDDQFAASPKRKDCKLDPNPSASSRRPQTPNTPTGHQHNNNNNNALKTPDLNGFNGGSNKTPTRSRAITHYFPFATKSDGGSSPAPLPLTDEDADADDGQHHHLHDNNNIDIAAYADENACDAYELLSGGGGPVDLSKTSSSNASNIFLQEPVLHLNIERSPQPASAIIQKHLHHNQQLHQHQQMSSFAALTATAVNCLQQLNEANHHAVADDDARNQHRCGGAGSVASSSSDDDGHVTRSPSSVSAPENSDDYAASSDSNSCDSGVVADRLHQQQQQHQQLQHSASQLSPSKRRKPMTPHRIVCPSPDKRLDVAATITDASAASASSSPSAAQQLAQQSSPLSALSALKMAALQHPKTRRRLNAGKKGAATIQQNQQQTLENSESSTEAETEAASVLAISAQNESNNTASTVTKAAPISAKTKAAAAAAAKPKTSAPTASAQLTDFFPVRRSVRKTKKVVEMEQQRYFEAAIRNEQEDGLTVAEFPNKGRGIMATRRFERGEFVVEYIGDLISSAEANCRETVYAEDENFGCYMYYFRHGEQQYCIDATAESGKLGRLINHSRNGNLVTKILVYRNRPHLVLLARDCIEAGDELEYDYGDRSKESLLHHPWLAL